MGVWLGAEEVAIVTGALFGRAEDGVGFAYADEAVGGVWVGGVEVGVVGFGEGVEFLLDFWGGGCGGEVEGCVVVWWAVVIAERAGGVKVS